MESRPAGISSRRVEAVMLEDIPFFNRLIRNVLSPLYERGLRRRLQGVKRPGHVAVMCDGNRRWAREAGFEDIAHGHRAGAVKIVEFLSWCHEDGIELVTLYLLSTENLSRSPEELAELLPIIGDVVDAIGAEGGQWRVRVVGKLDLLPKNLADRLREVERKTASRTGNFVNVAIGYGGRQEISDAVQDLLRSQIEAGVTGEDLVASITVPAIGEHLYTSGQQDPDLVIRTSGEQRLSGFLLWQTAYSEIWFTEAYWPEFRHMDFLRALRDYAARYRRFGA